MYQRELLGPWMITVPSPRQSAGGHLRASLCATEYTLPMENSAGYGTIWACGRRQSITLQTYLLQTAHCLLTNTEDGTYVLLKKLQTRKGSGV